jgi:hypothetical protein
MIGRSNTPRGTTPDFWKSNGVEYFANQSAWMTASIFNKLVRDFDASRTRPTILLLDNFSGHKIEDVNSLQFVIPVFLPPNTTSKTQPLDAGIIATFKLRYTRMLLDYISSALLDNSQHPRLTIALIVPWLVQSLKDVKPMTIQKCFFNALLLPMFNPRCEEDQLASLLANLSLSLNGQVSERNFSNSEILLAFTAEPTLEDFNEKEDENDDAQDIIVEDPLILLPLLRRLTTYVVNTGHFEFIESLEKLEETLNGHLNFTTV